MYELTYRSNVCGIVSSYGSYDQVKAIMAHLSEDEFISLKKVNA